MAAIDKGREPAVDPGRIDWQLLRDRAVAAMRQAYCPYSGYAVGAAALTSSGQIVSGCNIENASLGLTLCAECSLISDLFRLEAGKLLAFVCVDGQEQLLLPCGRCRQLLSEHSLPGMLLAGPAGNTPLEHLLPQAFGPEDLKSSAG